MVVVNWPGRTPVTKLPLNKALDEDERKALLMPELKCLPVSVDLVRVIDVGARVKTPRYLPETAEAEIKRFYEEIVQRLQKWVPKAPKVKPASVDGGERLPSDPNRVIDSGAGERSGFSGWNTHRPLGALLSPASGNHDAEMRRPGLVHGQ